MAGVGQKVGAHALVAARIGLVAHAEQGQPLDPLRRQGLGDGSPDPLQGAALLEDRLGLDTAVQRLLQRLQHPGIADVGGHQSARALQPQQVPGGGVGEDQAWLAVLLALVADQQNRVGQAFQHQGIGRIRTLGGRHAIGARNAPARAGPEQQGRESAGGQSGRRVHRHGRPGRPQHGEDRDRHQAPSDKGDAPARGAAGSKQIVDRGHGDSPLHYETPSHV